MGQTRAQRIVKQLAGNVQKQTPIATDMFIPNHSGDNSAGDVLKVPVNDTDIPNKKYVDDNDHANAGTAQGQMSFWDNALSKWVPTETTELFWDDVNKRLGIGTNNPSDPLGIRQTVANRAFRITEASGAGFGEMHIRSGGDFEFFGSSKVSFNSQTEMDFIARGGSRIIDIRCSRLDVGQVAGRNVPLRLYGEIAAGGQKYIQHEILDSDDRLHLTRQDTNILGYDIEMPTTITDTLEVNAKSKLTPIGGIAIKLTNKTGANSVAGGLVVASTGTDDAVMTGGTLEDETIGVFLEDGVSDGSEAWVVVSGIADVLFDDNVGTTRGYWCSAGTTAGTANISATVTPARHFEEIGHCIETVAAGGIGTNIKARCVLHFN
jgi:hypothetical protein